jgi:hypothetical protein
VVEDEKVLEVVIRLEEETASATSGIGRRMTVVTIATRSQRNTYEDEAVSPMQHVDTGTCRVIVQPELAHTRTDGRDLATEGIAATDYFFGDQGSQSPTAEKRPIGKNSKRKTTFSDWCNG